ncbi:agmatine deiminase [Enterovibrio norvegicus FF-33]|uniref:agmatine deiminase family protein n=1 Tax=Enterovibrio norvegicus TaxID=188144 RepID=UPI0002DE5058|nr:agmatine deiminase family protein [Enterovibrio norvegicus]OEE68359.1 agmatine deiminase [Enterovibrio norvegicus FF-33]
MISRRRFIQHASVLAMTLPLTHLLSAKTTGATNFSQGWFMPDEASPHVRTWMAFGANKQIWGSDLLPVVQENLADIALTIAKYEPVSMLVRQKDMALAKSLMGDKVDLIVGDMDDLWARDTAPTFVLSNVGNTGAVDFNFNGWGDKQMHQKDATVATQIAKLANVPVINTPLVMEGGCIEVDGIGTAIITESCTLNNNRNPNMSKAQFEDLIMPLLGLEKIIWLPGIKGRDITDGHTDFYARFTTPGNVVVGIDTDPNSYEFALTREHANILANATDAQGNRLTVNPLETPSSVREEYDDPDFAAGYVGFYVCNGAVIMQEFGDKAADKKAKETLELLFPDRQIEALNLDAIAAGGGSVHCATQQEPKAMDKLK